MLRSPTDGVLLRGELAVPGDSVGRVQRAGAHLALPCPYPGMHPVHRRRRRRLPTAAARRSTSDRPHEGRRARAWASRHGDARSRQAAARGSRTGLDRAVGLDGSACTLTRSPRPQTSAGSRVTYHVAHEGRLASRLPVELVHHEGRPPTGEALDGALRVPHHRDRPSLSPREGSRAAGRQDRRARARAGQAARLRVQGRAPSSSCKPSSTACGLVADVRRATGCRDVVARSGAGHGVATSSDRGA